MPEFDHGNLYVCGVFDGHSYEGSNGGKVAQMAADTIWPALKARLDRHAIIDRAGINEAFADLNDIAVSEKQYRGGGCTSVVGILHEQNFYIANTGDSQALVVFKDGTHVLTTPHNPIPGNQEEARIKRASGVIIKKNISTLQLKNRYAVLGGTRTATYQLCVSRSIGDADFKPFGVTWEPDVLNFPANQIDYVIFATDGFWDVILDIESLKNRIASLKVRKESVSQICQSLAESARELRSQDDITVLSIFFK